MIAHTGPAITILYYNYPYYCSSPDRAKKTPNFT